MTSSISRSIKQRDISKDVFYTPDKLMREHLNLVVEYTTPNDKWYDPFYGEGIYYNNYPTDNKDFSEITLGKDFFSYNTKVDIIVSNPPYSMIDKVLKHSVSLKPRVISYLIGMGNLTTRRIEYMNQQGYGMVKLHLTKVYKWYGMSFIVVFVKDTNNCISFDRIVHK